jgi:hypothetical protein
MPWSDTSTNNVVDAGGLASSIREAGLWTHVPKTRGGKRARSVARRP